MIFKDERVVWKVRDGVNIPYAKAEDSTISAPASNEAPIFPSQTDAIREDEQLKLGVNSISVPVKNESSVEIEAVSQSAAPVAVDAVLQKISAQNTIETAVSPSLEKNPVPAGNEVSAPDKKNTLIDDLGDNAGQSTVQTPALHLDSVFFNPNTPKPIVEGQVVARESNAPAATFIAKVAWLDKPYVLRKKRADIYVNMNSKVDYLSSLVNYLKDKGFDIKAYDDRVHYLPSDILFLDSNDLVAQGTVYYLNNGKKFIWNALKEEFGDRLK